ncbi:MAG TPA: hypothetical protein VKV73_15225 [Chloroflexota bacterium]|nr:hypothetical protein [Chloroflexota bacterium]
MKDQYIGRLTSQMEVCDVLGYRIGTIARVHRDEYALVEAHVGPSEERPQTDGVMEVKTGPLGLGPRLYVPVTEIREVIDESVFLDKNKNEVARDWRTKPGFLADLY